MTVVDGTGAPPVGPMDIVVAGNRITQIRSVGTPVDETLVYLQQFGFGKAIAVDPAWNLTMAEGVRIDRSVGQTIAPAVGAAAGRA